MSKEQFTELLTIAGTVILIGLLPTISDALVPASFAQSYQDQTQPSAATAPMLGSPTVKSLGTLDSSDMSATPQPNPAATNPASYGANVGAAAAQSDTQDAAPQPIQVGGTTYVTGGIGDDERDALDSVKKNYNLHVLNASKSGAYIGDTHVVVRNRQGSEVLNVSSGPILLANLPTGTYTLVASSEGQNKTEPVKIGGTKPVSVRLTWN
jgi:hypothetical protein